MVYFEPWINGSVQAHSNGQQRYRQILITTRVGSENEGDSRTVLTWNKFSFTIKLQQTEFAENITQISSVISLHGTQVVPGDRA